MAGNLRDTTQATTLNFSRRTDEIRGKVSLDIWCSA